MQLKLERKLQDKLDLIHKRQPIVETLEEQGVKAAFEQAKKRKLEEDETSRKRFKSGVVEVIVKAQNDLCSNVN